MCIRDRSSTERVRRLRQQQRKDRDREELNEFLMNTPFSSNTTEDEKIRAFQTLHINITFSLCTLYVSKA